MTLDEIRILIQAGMLLLAFLKFMGYGKKDKKKPP